MNLCVIPARSGSKRIVDKNIKLFNGMPIIAWSILSAVESNCFDKVIVSTDSQVIADISENYGAVIPFLRPKELADDYCGTTPVVIHAINWFIKNNENFDKICCLYPTAPLLSFKSIIVGKNILDSSDADFSVSVSSFPYPPQRALKINESEKLEMLHPELFNFRSQDLEDLWHDAGQFYWGKKHAWLGDKTFFQGNTAPVVVPRHTVVDIDTIEDWREAEILSQVIGTKSS